MLVGELYSERDDGHDTTLDRRPPGPTFRNFGDLTRVADHEVEVVHPFACTLVKCCNKGKGESDKGGKRVHVSV